MKTYIPYSLLAALAACGMASGASTAYTTPVGYETISLPAGVEYNVTGLRLHSPNSAAGLLTAVASSKVSDSTTNFDTLLTAGKTYILEIKTGAKAGLIQEIVSWGTGSGNTSNDLVTSANLAALGVAVGDQYSLRVAPTLETTFVAGTVLTGFTATQADNVWIPNGLGGYDKYYKSAVTGNPWKNAANNANTPNVPIIYQDGIIVQKRAASPSSSVVVSGEVKKSATITPLLAGTVSVPSYNLISTVYPAGATLFTAGIKSSLLAGFTASASDNVWVPNGAGGYVKYYVSALTGNPWKLSSNNANVTVDVDLTPGVLIERKAAATNLTLTPPASYSSL
jgi:hypothetical protein